MITIDKNKLPAVIWQHGPHSVVAESEKDGIIYVRWDRLGQHTTKHQITGNWTPNMEENFMIERLKNIGVIKEAEESKKKNASNS